MELKPKDDDDDDEEKDPNIIETADKTDEDGKPLESDLPEAESRDIYSTAKYLDLESVVWGGIFRP